MTTRRLLIAAAAILVVAIAVIGTSMYLLFRNYAPTRPLTCDRYVAGCPSAVVPAAAAPAATLPADDLALAIAVRTRYGLRTDEDWIRLVAKDPSNGTLSGVPLTKAEEAIVAQRIAPTEAVGHMVGGYAANLPEYGGQTIDWDRGGVIVVYFTGDPEPHRKTLARILPPGSRFDVVIVRYTRAELLALSRQVDPAWLESIDAKFVSSGVDTKRNQAFVKVLSSNPLVGETIIAHYNALGRMYVESNGGH